MLDEELLEEEEELPFGGEGDGEDKPSGDDEF
jgi:hypothetical protein